MIRAMSTAELGDDVFDDDPTVHRLQEKVATLLGKEAALFMPSGTMSNQIGLRLHCSPGDEFLCEAGCHIYVYEQGAFAQLSGLVAHTIDGEFGLLRAEQLDGRIRPDNDHCVRTKLLSLENTHNRGSGRVWPIEQMKQCVDWARKNKIATHLDGARLFNAVIASGISAREWAAMFDTVSVCFSKGLGCPIGSALAGPKDMIKLARRYRKLFGGAMRQVGVLASAAIYALDNHVERMTDDHKNAKRFAEIVTELHGCELRPATIDSNIVIFRIDPTLGTAASIVERCNAHGLLMYAIGPQMIRIVTHLDVNAEAVEQASVILKNLWKELPKK
jgi:threonine aldolase